MIEIKSNIEQNCRVENRLLTIKKDIVNQSIKAETFASVRKTITKIIKNENQKKIVVKKTTTTNMMTAKKKQETNDKSKERNQKKEIKIDIRR